jgi:hypothetical protein
MEPNFVPVYFGVAHNERIMVIFVLKVSYVKLSKFIWDYYVVIKDLKFNYPVGQAV